MSDNARFESRPELSHRKLVPQLGLSLGVINYCLKALAEKGLVKIKNFANSRNKFWYVYVLTPAGLAEKATIAHRLLRRKMNECEVLRAEVENPGDERTKKA